MSLNPFRMPSSVTSHQRTTTLSSSRSSRPHSSHHTSYRQQPHAAVSSTQVASARLAQEPNMQANRSTTGGPPRQYRKKADPTKRGYFENNTWYCDCEPRLPAVDFVVKKESPNKGKKFYTCQQEQESRCKFFLWADEARQREKAAVLNNSHTEPMTPVTERAIKMAEYDPDGTDSEPEPSPSRRKQPNVLKRSADMAGLDGVNEYDDDVVNQIQLEDLSHTLSPETPPQERTISYPTPDTTAFKKRKLPWQEGGLATPSKTRMEELMTPSKPIQAETAPPAVKTPDRPTEAAAISPPRIPRHYDALADPDDSESPLANEVLAQLASSAVPVDKINKIRRILTRHEMHARGVEKGRDMSRLALEKQKTRNGELEAKIRHLESRLTLAKTRVPGKAAAALRR